MSYKEINNINNKIIKHSKNIIMLSECYVEFIKLTFDK